MAGYSKDIERLARSLAGQKLEREYIKHYLIEAFQLEPKAVDDLLERLGLPKRPPNAKVPPKKQEETKPKRQGFY
jgi:hypothetical protein